MARKLEQIMADLPAISRAAVEARADDLATLKDLRQDVGQNRQDLTAIPSPQWDTGGTVGQITATLDHTAQQASCAKLLIWLWLFVVLICG